MRISWKQTFLRLLGIFLSGSWLCLFSLSAFAAPNFPELTGRVVDNANLLSVESQQYWEQRLEEHEQESSNQVVLVTLTDLQGYDIADFGYQLGRHWGIGQKNSNNGLLLIIAPTERQVRIEVGYGLEGVMSDGLSHTVIQQHIIPPFKQGDYSTGIEQGLTHILEILNADPDKLARMQENAERYSSDDGNGGWMAIIIIIFSILSTVMRRATKQKLAIPAALITGGIVGFMIAWPAGLIAGIFVLVILLSSGQGGGFGGGGFSSGGGFSGGGGSFGGGGASGSW